MVWLYNFCFHVALVLAAPFYFIKLVRRGGWRENFGQRWGRYDGQIKQALTNRQIIWLHAVSVGEVNLCIQLVRALQPRLPFHKLVVSTTTSTGMAQLQQRLPREVTRVYYPIDRRQSVQRAINTLHPQVMVFVESELWPNMLWALQRRGIPRILINARISDKSFRGYSRAGFIFRKIFAGFSGIGVQNEADAQRLLKLGARPAAVQVMGSLKFDAATTPQPEAIQARKILRQLGIADDALVLVGGSTHPGEEAILVGIAQRLKKRFSSLFLILVPRHQERGGEVGRTLNELGCRFIHRSLVTPVLQETPGKYDCLLVNTTGELNSFYSCADVVFVGKSLTAEGGQNPIEPAALGKAVVFGPHMQNFPQIVPEFLSRNAARQVADAADLERCIGELLSNRAERERLGNAARGVVRENQGGMEKAVEMIVRIVHA